MDNKPTVLCIAASPIGRPFMIQAHRLGWRVIVLTTPKFIDAAWPREAVEEVYAVKNLLDEKDVRNAISFLCREREINRIVPLADYEVSVASKLREHLRIPGMGDTTTRYFRDKLAMRVKAEEDGIPMPEFVHILNYPKIREFIERIPAPWLLKPRSEAASYKITRIETADELWKKIDELGDNQSDYLLERYIPGSVYHVDSIVSERQVVFASVSKYGKPMLDLNDTGGVFVSQMVKRETRDDIALQKLNKEVISTLGLVRGVTHIEFLKNEKNHKFFFLEAAARVGAARIPDVIWHATGICLWHEWAKIELADFYRDYKLPAYTERYAAVALCLSDQEYPDMSSFDAPEVCWRQENKKNHAGIIVAADEYEKVDELITQYAAKLANEVMSHHPKPTT